MQDPAPQASVFTALDWVGAAAAGFVGLALLAFPIAGRNFAAMYRSFGSRESLPRLTLLAVSWWFPLALGVVVVAIVALASGRRLSLPARRACVLAAFVAGCAGVALCMIGAYLPIYELAGAVNAE